MALAARGALVRDARARARGGAVCGVRTPFQRDRDRIVHSKPFRRLKGKTQVFIDPQGDHYRTRMTHTLETTAISRVVARALAAERGPDRGDRARARPGPHAVRPRRRGRARRGAARRASGCGFRHNEQSHRIARRLNLTHEVCEGILTHTGPVEPETLEGRNRPHRRPRRVHQPRHRRRRPLRAARRRRSAARRDRAARPDAAPSASTGSSTTWSRPRPTPATSARARRSARAMHRLRELHVRARLPRRARARRSTAARTRRSSGSSPTWSSAATRPNEIVEYVAGMTDRFALAYAAAPAADGADQGRLGRGGQGRDRHRHARRGLHAAPEVRQPVHRPLPVPPGEDAELRRLARPRHVQVLRLRRGRRRDRLRREEGERRLRRRDRVARRPLRRPARVRGDLAGAGPAAQAARAAVPAARPRGDLLRALPLGVGGGGVRTRVPGGARTGARRSAASSASGSRRAAPR